MPLARKLINITYTFSIFEIGVISPNPIVIIVIKAKYNELIYLSVIVLFVKC